MKLRFKPPCFAYYNKNDKKFLVFLIKGNSLYNDYEGFFFHKFLELEKIHNSGLPFRFDRNLFEEYKLEEFK